MIPNKTWGQKPCELSLFNDIKLIHVNACTFMIPKWKWKFLQTPLLNLNYSFIECTLSMFLKFIGITYSHQVIWMTSCSNKTPNNAHFTYLRANACFKFNLLIFTNFSKIKQHNCSWCLQYFYFHIKSWIFAVDDDSWCFSSPSTGNGL